MSNDNARPFPTYRASPEAQLLKIHDLLAEDAADGCAQTTIDIFLVLALLRFALNRGAVTVGDVSAHQPEAT